jgi:hypothetical protein
MTDADDTRQAAWKLFDGADGVVAVAAALAAAIERVRALHRPYVEKFANGDSRTMCLECEMEYHPCPTVRALDGETPDKPAR